MPYLRHVETSCRWTDSTAIASSIEYPEGSPRNTVSAPLAITTDALVEQKTPGLPLRPLPCLR